MKKSLVILVTVVCFGFSGCGQKGVGTVATQKNESTKVAPVVQATPPAPVAQVTQVTPVESRSTVSEIVPGTSLASELEKPKVVNKGEFKINGVSSSEDIGGVDMFTGAESIGASSRIVFKNNNNFAVSVVFELGTIGETKTGTIDLKANERKETRNNYYQPYDLKLIVRKKVD